MKRTDILVRAEWCKGVAAQATTCAAVLGRMAADMPDDVVAVVHTIREVDLGRGVVIEVGVYSSDYLWPLFVWLHEHIGPVAGPVYGSLMFGSPARTAVRIVWARS